MIAPAPVADAILSCSLCWSGNGDTLDSETGATVCWECQAELSSRRAHPAAQAQPVASSVVPLRSRQAS
jgi:hypothetical protein